MSLVKVTFRNKDKLARKLKALAPAAQKALNDVNLKSGAEMVATAKGFVPVKTGTLRNSIRSETAGGVETGAVRVLAGGPSTTKPSGGGSYDYALGVEFGNSQAPRQSFFFTAFRLTAKRHRSRASRALNKSIKAVAGK